MVAPNKQRTLAKLQTVLSKNYDADVPKDLSVLDHLLLGVVQEGMGFTKALECYQKLVHGFHDLNEMRVSHPAEIAEALGDATDRDQKANRILQILQFVFETTYSYDLEQFRKKPLKQAQKQISKIQGTSSFAIAAVVQRCLGGHAIPVDGGTLEFLREIDFIEPEETVEQLQAVLEHLVPKAKGPQFSLLLSEMVFDNPKRQKQLLKDFGPRSGNKPRAPKAPAEREDDKAAQAKQRVEKKAAKKK